MGTASWVTRAVRGEGLAGDVLLAVLLLAVEVLLVVLAPTALQAPSRPAAVGWAVFEMTAVALRRRRPWIAITITAVHAVAACADPANASQTGFAVVVVSYTAAALLPFRHALAAVTLMWLPGLTITVVTGSLWTMFGLSTGYYLVFCVLMALVCFFVGRTVFNRRAFAAALEDRARTAEATQAARTAQAVAEERQRIARELHDVVAHHISVMGVMATGSRRALTRDPAAADEALATIEQTGRTVLREMRRILDVLRADRAGPGRPGGSGDGLEPQPGIGEIAGLVDQVREAGLPVTLVVDPRLEAGASGRLDPGVALTAYRIVQEALTNALKHARAPSAEVRLTLAPGVLELEVSDTGRGPQPGGSPHGHGLLGMRERVALYGGSLRIGPRPGGGFRVCARIPLEPSEGSRSRSGATGPALEPPRTTA